ncbi:MAG: inositol monophosphatase [Deltaproteobacteria bacterium]|nr:inositol monophosphatase [Deltaproteobacteria bacterium]MBW2071965.1 inositol monophosphatase [Deltaproteobacteria bacterium]
MDESLLKTMLESARKGGEVLMKYHLASDDLHVRTKGKFDYVTEADVAAQRAIVAVIQEHYPEHDILAEEAAATTRRSAIRWIVDPLDGTTNFIHGFPVFAVTVAIESEGTVLAGVVYDPTREELFLAEKDRGATLNGKPLAVSATREASEMLIATSFPWRKKLLLERYLAAFKCMFARVNDFRRTGSAALDLAYVAAGRCDGFWELGLKPWDIAAGHLLVHEAGGKISDFSGGDRHIWVGDVVAGNTAAHDFLLPVIKGVFGGNVSQPLKASP